MAEAMAHIESEVGTLIRERRRELGLTLSALAERAGCTKGYLSEIETGRRPAPGEELLRVLEAVLGLAAGRLTSAACWSRTPPVVRSELTRLAGKEQAARRLAALLRSGGFDGDGRARGALDSAHESGELRRLIETLDPVEEGPLAELLPREVPLINSVAAGYPREFTDLGYPARVADEYVRAPDICDADAFAARVVGDSMMPEYREGDVVIFSPARTVRSGMDCFARLEPDAETTFKRVFFERSAEGREAIRLQPLNPAYAPRVLEREMVAGLYAAVSVIRRV